MKITARMKAQKSHIKFKAGQVYAREGTDGRTDYYIAAAYTAYTSACYLVNLESGMLLCSPCSLEEIEVKLNSGIFTPVNNVELTVDPH